MPVLVNIPGLDRPVRFPDDWSKEQVDEAAARVYDVNVRIPKLKSEITSNLQESQNKTIEAGAYKVGEYAARAVDIFGAINWLGDVAAGFATDLIQGRVLPSPSRGAVPNLSSTGAAIVQQPDTSVNTQLTPTQSGMVEGARSTPTVVAGMATTAAGVPAPLAYGTIMGGTTLRHTGSFIEAGKSGTVGALVPGVGNASKAFAGRAIASAVNRGIVSAENVTAQKVIEAASEFAGIASFIEALNIPGYVTMSPGERSDALAKSLASQLAFLPMSIMGLRGIRPSETQRVLAGEPTIPTYTPEPPKPAERLLLPEVSTAPPEPRGPLITPPPAGKPTMTQIEMAMRDLAVKARQTVPEPAKREAQLGEIPIIGQRPVTIEQQLILPERFMQAEAKRDSLVAEQQKITEEFSNSLRNLDFTGMQASTRQLEAIYNGLAENKTVRESLSEQLEGDYPPTAEQLGTFQSRAVVPELSDVTKRPEPGKLPEANQPESTRLRAGRPVQPVEGQVYPEPPVGVVPPETLKSEFVPQADIPEYPPARPPKLAPEAEQRSGIIRGSDLERWADKVISEDPRAGGLLMQMDPKAEARRAAAWAVKGAAIIEGGIRDFAAWSAEMVRQFGEGIRPVLDDLYRKSTKYLEVKQAQQAQEGVPEQAQATPSKPEIAKKPARESTHKNPLGDTMGTTYYGTPEDVARYKELQAQFGELIKQGKDLSSPEVAPVLKENEAIKNKYGGMPPVERPALVTEFSDTSKTKKEKGKSKMNIGMDFVSDPANKGKYIPAVKTAEGDIITGSDHAQAWEKMRKEGKKPADNKVMGYLDQDGKFRTLVDIGILEGKEKGGETDAIHETADEILRPVQEPSGEGAGEVPTAERPQQNAPTPQGVTPEPSGSRTERLITTEGGGPSETQRQVQGEEVLGPKPLRPLGEIYSEPFAERIRRLGGPVADRVAKDTQRIIDNAKRLYGELSADWLDKAKKASGKAFRGGTTWMNGIDKVKNAAGSVNPRAAIGRMFTAIETFNNTGNWNHVPSGARNLAQMLYDANLAIGRLANSGNPIGPAESVKRLVTPWGVDVLKRGRGRAWDVLIKGYAEANNKSIADTEAFFSNWKAELDKPVPDAASLDKISKEFVAQFPNAVTHIRPILGWHEFLQAAPFHYLEQSGQRTANTVAFQQVYPPGSGALNQTRTAIQAEIKTDSGMAEFDNMTRALRGYPTDVVANWYNAPDTLVGATSRAIGMGLRPIKSLLLTQSLATNTGETLSGGSGIFLGYDRAFKALYTNSQLRQQQIRSGKINKAIRDFSFDPTKPLQSLSKYASNLISRTFLNDFANEVQEFSSARAAEIVANEIRTGTLPASDVPLVENTMRAMGFTKEQAKAAVAGNAPDVINQFETKAAEFLSSGNQILAEKSRLGSSRSFNQLFWFQSYPMLKFRQARSILNNIIEDASTKDWNGVYNNSKLLGRFVGGTALSGAITAGVLATIKEGLYGAGIRKQEAQDDFGRFVVDSFLMGMGGPLQTWTKIFEESGSLEQFRDNAQNAVFESFTPYSMYSNLSRAVSGVGEYEGLDSFEKVGKFLESKTPGLRPFKAAMASAELIKDNPKLDAAISAYYRWSRREVGINKTEIRKFNDDRKEVRGFAKAVVNAIRDGEDFADPLVKSIVAAAGTKTDNPFDSAARSIRGKQVIANRLSPEDMVALRKHIGDDPVNRIMAYDMMLDKVSDYVAGLK